MYNELEDDILDSLLNEVINEEDLILNIRPLSIDISPAKLKPIINHNPSKSSSVKTFIGKEQKVINFGSLKHPGIVKPTISDPLSLIMSISSFVIVVWTKLLLTIIGKKRRKSSMLYFIPERVKESWTLYLRECVVLYL